MDQPKSTAGALRWAGRVVVLIILSYFCYSMLLMGYIAVGTGLEPYGQVHRVFYLTSGPLLILGGVGIFVFMVRWVAKLIRRTNGEPRTAA